MSLRIDTTELISGALLIGETGLGVLGSAIPATGDNGAGYAYNDLSLPADNSKEICGRITTWPSAGTLFAYEDTSFDFTAPDGAYSFQYQLYVDGVATGSPTTVNLQVGAGPQQLTASQLNNTSLFYSPTLAPGAVTVAPSLYSNTAIFYSPLLSPGAVSLATALYSNAPTFYVPVLQSTVGLLPGLHSNSQSFYPPTLSTSKTLTPSLYSNGQTFYIPTVSIDGGPQQLTASLLDNASIFYSPLLAPGAVAVTSSLYSNAQAFYILTLTTSKTLTPALFANSNTIYDPVVSLDSAPQVVAPSLFANTQSYFTQTVSPGAVSLFPILLTNSSTFYAATVANGGSFTGSLSDEDIARIAAAVLQAIASLQAGPIPVVVANRDQIAADVWGFTIQ